VSEGPAGPGNGEDDAVRPTGAGRLVVRFFLLPLLVVGTAVGIFLVFSLMTFERRSPRDYLARDWLIGNIRIESMHAAWYLDWARAHGAPQPISGSIYG